MPILGNCPVCGKQYHLQKTYDGVGGSYEVFIHKREDGMGHLKIETGRCTRNVPVPIAKITTAVH